MVHVKGREIQQQYRFTTASLDCALRGFEPEEQIIRRRTDRDAVGSPIADHRAATINPIGSGEVAVGLERETATGRRPRDGHG